MNLECFKSVISICYEVHLMAVSPGFACTASRVSLSPWQPRSLHSCSISASFGFSHWTTGAQQAAQQGRHTFCSHPDTPKTSQAFLLRATTFLSRMSSVALLCYVTQATPQCNHQRRTSMRDLVARILVPLVYTMLACIPRS